MVSASNKSAEKPSESLTKLKSSDVLGVLAKNTCSACHGIDNKIVGPSFKDIAAKHSGRSDAVAYLLVKMKSGGSGVYGAVPMPPQSIGELDAKKVAQWIAQGATK
jgi:cytochrome c